MAEQLIGAILIHFVNVVAQAFYGDLGEAGETGQAWTWRFAL